MSWGFNPAEKRVVIQLPRALGGETHILCIAGSYTFTALPQQAEVEAPRDADVAMAQSG
ncbi:MAG TPA: hypothetical protein VHE35_02410 [Kofleriaceae bacterium]|nr:hypothetical protein [Kofleriaceae bacterium]